MTMERSKEELERLARDVIALNTPDTPIANSHCAAPNCSLIDKWESLARSWMRLADQMANDPDLADRAAVRAAIYQDCADDLKANSKIGRCEPTDSEFYVFATVKAGFEPTYSETKIKKGEVELSLTHNEVMEMIDTLRGMRGNISSSEMDGYVPKETHLYSQN